MCVSLSMHLVVFAIILSMQLVSMGVGFMSFNLTTSLGGLHCHKNLVIIGVDEIARTFCIIILIYTRICVCVPRVCA